MKIKELCDLFTRDEIIKWFSDYNMNDYLTNDEIETIKNRNTWTKEKLANMIIDHYYMSEICAETPGLFKLFVKTKMNEIMESKLPLIYSNSIHYDPLVNVDYTETFKRDLSDDTTSSGSSESTQNQSGNGIQLDSNTPQGRVSKSSILEGNYVSSTTGSESSSNTSENNTSNTTENKNVAENYTKNIKGNSGVSATAQKMIEQYRQNIRAINLEIINELNDLFFIIF